MLKGIFLSLTGLNCLSILFRTVIDMRIFHIAKNTRTRSYFVIAQQKTKLKFCAAHYLKENQRKKCSHMHSIQYKLRLAIDQAFSAGIEMHQCQTGTNKATASRHVLSLLVKNEECIETATSPLQNATEDDNTICQSLL